MLHSAVHCTGQTQCGAFCTLQIAHCTVYIAPCTLHSAHCILNNAHCTLYNVNCIFHCILHIAQCKLHISLHIAHCTLHSAQCNLQSVLQASWFIILPSNTLQKTTAIWDLLETISASKNSLKIIHKKEKLLNSQHISTGEIKFSEQRITGI